MRKKKSSAKDKNHFLNLGEDEATAEMLAAYELGTPASVKRSQKLHDEAVKAAAQYLRKDARINVRLSSTDLMMLKRRASSEGMPYQTLVASILHKYVSGSLSLD